ncbi:MAG: MerR family transcriptional regulator [Bacillota bacterium]|nr:MerR family transcriptional regulator [Bacillota bacterium]
MDRQSGGEEPVFSIGTVEKLTGLTSRQIRYYETKGLVRPGRTPGHQRVYTRAQVERLRQIKRLLDEGRSLQSIAEELASAEQEAAHEAVRYAAPERFLRHGLTSLYPVREAGELTRLLESRRREERAAERESGAGAGESGRRGRGRRRRDGQEDA